MFSERTNWRLTPNRFTQAVQEARARGAHLLDLTASNPTRVGLEYDSEAILGSLRSQQALDYEPQAKGLLEARQAITRYYSETFPRGERHVVVDPERIVLTTSTSEGYSFVFRLLCNAGDELLVPKPSYPLFEFLADLQDVKLVPYPLIYDHGWQMDFHSLEQAVTPRTRGVVAVHPNNPTGSYVKSAEVELLNAFCRERGLALIVDEVFLDYQLNASVAKAPTPKHFPDRAAEGAAPPNDEVDVRLDTGSLHARSDRHSPIRRLGRDDSGKSFVRNDDVLTFTLSGLSKISALPQMKVAWIVTSGPAEQVADAMGRLEVIADTYLSINAPVQWAFPVLMEQRHSIHAQLIARVKRNLEELDRQLADQKACLRLCVEGGWYAVLRVPVTRSDEELAIALVMEKSVIVHPGHFYDFESDGYLVLSLIAPWEEFAEGVRRVLNLLSC